MSGKKTRIQLIVHNAALFLIYCLFLHFHQYVYRASILFIKKKYYMYNLDIGISVITST